MNFLGRHLVARYMNEFIQKWSLIGASTAIGALTTDQSSAC